MFFPERLVKIRVYSPVRMRADVVQALYDFGVIHVTPTIHFASDRPLEQYRSISEKLIALRSLAAQVPLPQGKGRQRAMADLEADFEELGIEEIFAWLKERTELSNTLSNLHLEEQKLRPFRHLSINPKWLHTRRLKFAYVQPGEKFPWDRLKGVPHETQTVRDENLQYVLVAYDAKQEEKVQPVLALAEKRLEIPDPNGATFRQAWENIEVRGQNAEVALSSLQKRIDWFLKRKAKACADVLACLEVEAKKAELPTKFGQSVTLSVAEGWIPEKKYGDLERALEKQLGNKVLLESVKTTQTPPTKLDNPRPIRPFEFLVQALSLPKYNELDPTILVFLSFPFFFGMILGDVGYGLAMVALALILRQKYPEGFFRSISGMMILSGLWTMVFGFIFGEFLGAERVLGYELHPLIHRLQAEGIDALMQLSLVFGFLHLGIGFALGTYVNLREHHVKHAIAKASWLVLLMGILGFLSLTANITALNVFQSYGQFFSPDIWLGLSGVTLVALLLTEGGNALLEIPSLIGNLVSYLRIMALGIVGAVLALMVNTIPLEPTLDLGGLVAFVLFTVFFIVGQVFALALGIFESSIQSLRLHYVEFFSKFYQGGGTAFVSLREGSERK
ncbi:V-type ATP synthase subunit I [Candidatus Micrarchaeota archaeon]|nr:V-type ATP synthase subunit I [Candidatus Micrarchaeota archaeon]